MGYDAVRSYRAVDRLSNKRPLNPAMQESGRTIARRHGRVGVRQ
ncbi:hypothetical protein SAMCCGM7_pB0132 (plasmid) [Sinorhizobium americanum CCGM7]|nr:hypothetical protein SAMCCGM7_pB0132 [Sinorhizobium americanum CCGM7]